MSSDALPALPRRLDAILAAAGVSDGATWANGPLTPAEMAKLDGLEDHLRSGRLGRADGWAPEDVAGPDWDPTTYVA